MSDFTIGVDFGTQSVRAIVVRTGRWQIRTIT